MSNDLTAAGVAPQEPLGDLVFRAAAAIAETQARRQNLPPEVIQGVTREHIQDAKAALTAAGVASQEPSAVTDINGHSWMTWEESGKNGTYCRSCGGWAGKVGNRQCSSAPELPSSGIDEETLAEVIAKSRGFGKGWEQIPPLTREAYRDVARAVTAWLKDEAQS